MRQFRLSEMTWPQVQEALDSGIDTVLVTFGATEQHGLHLPLGTDWMWGEELGERVAAALGDTLLAPALRVGCSEHHLEFPGSLSLSLDTFCRVVADYCQSLARHGFRHIVLLPTHGGNFGPLAEAVRRLGTVGGARIIAYTDLEQILGHIFGVSHRQGFTAAQAGGHAGQWETSMILALRPDLVAMERAEAGFMGGMTDILGQIFRRGWKAVTPNGVLGDPTGSEGAAGAEYLQSMTDHIVAFIRGQRDADRN